MSTLILIDKQIDILPKIRTNHVLIILFSENQNALIKIKKELSSNNITFDIIDFLTLFKNEYETIKEAYLKWTFDFSLQHSGNKTIREHLEHDGFSLWWHTSIAEKNVIKHPFIPTILKLMMLEKVIKQYNIDHLICLSSDLNLKNTLYDLCTGLTIQSNLDKPKPIKTNRFLLFIKNLFRATLRLFKEIYKIVCLRLMHKKSTIQNNAPLFFLYYPNIDIKNNNKGIFYSNYLGGLNTYLKTIKANFIFFYHSAQNISYKDMIRNCNKYNQISKHHSHFILEESLSIVCLLKTYFIWIFKVIKYSNLLNKEYFKFKNSNLNGYYFFYSNFCNDLLGSGLFSALLNSKKFKAIANKFNNSDSLFYLMENQSWEKTLLFYWHKFNKKTTTIGIFHSAFRNGVLFLFDHKKAYSDIFTFSCEYPNYIAVNGHIAKHYFSTLVQHSSIQTVDIEAQRYSYLEGCLPNKQGQNLLIVTSISESETLQLLTLISNSIKNQNMPFKKIIIKPHPYLNIKEVLSKVDNLPAIDICTTSIQNALDGVGWVICNSSSTVIIETLAVKIPTISLATIDSFSLLPIDKDDNLHLAYNESEFSDLLNSPPKQILAESPPYFFLDKSFRRWKSILNSPKS